MADSHPGRPDVLGLAAGGVTALVLPGAARAAATRSSLLRVSDRSNPSSLDPMVGTAGGDHVALFPIYATLVEWDYATLQARLGIAEEWHFYDPLTLVVESALFCPLVFDPEIDAYGPRARNYRPNLIGKPKLAEVMLA